MAPRRPASNSLNRKRKLPKFYPGQVKPKRSPGPGTAAPTEAKGPTNPNARVRISPPPSLAANHSPMPAGMAGTAVGQPARNPLPVDIDPFGAVGDYAGSFLIKSAVELRGGYDTNPGRLSPPYGAPFWVVAPEFLAVSDWERHALVADLRGSYTGYGNSMPTLVDGAASPSPTDVSRPDFLGHVDGRLDVTDFTHITAQARLRVGTDNPGSPNVSVGLAISGVRDLRQHGRDRSAVQPAGCCGRRDVRSHGLSELVAHRRLDREQRGTVLSTSMAASAASATS